MKKSSAVLIHILFWIVLLLSYFLIPLGTRFLLLSPFRNYAIWVNIFIPAYFYFSYFFSLEIMRVSKWMIYTIVLSIVGYCLSLLLTQSFMGSLYIFTVILYWSFLGGLIRYFIDWFNKKKIQQQLEKQNFQSELALLRNQVNPHFLFNTLHNIDALIQKDSKRASDTLIKLSEIMRYMVYDTDFDFVDLSKEIEYLKNFITLQMLCQSNQELVTFNIKGNSNDVRIAPMLFIPFIENAFKHATNKDTRHNIRIDFEILSKTVKFEMVNICNKNEIFIKYKSSGIGLSVVKRRLELLYPNKYKLKIENDNNQYHIILNIDIYGN